VAVDLMEVAVPMLALVLMDHYLRHRGQNADVVSSTPVLPGSAAS
jgi:chorismate synthase